MAQRTDEQYALDSGLRLLKVLEALEGTNFEPATVQRVHQRCQQHGDGFSFNFCFRALKTLKVAGYATETSGQWQVGPKVLKFSERFNELCLATIQG